MVNSKTYFKSLIVQLFIISPFYLQSQEDKLLAIPDSLRRSETVFQIPDSLENKNFAYLENRFYENFDDYETALFYANTYYKKSNDNNTIFRKAKALLLLSRITNGPTKILYLDRVIELTKDVGNKYYPASGYFEKAQYYFEQQEYKNASDNYIQTNYYAKKYKNRELENTALFSLGILKSRLGKIEEAKIIFDKCFRYSKTKYIENIEFAEGYLYALFAKSDTHTRLKQLDSATKTNRVGITESLQNKDSILYNYFVMNEGVNLYHKKEYDTALDSINKAIPILEEIGDLSNVMFSYFYLGKSYHGKKDTINAIKNFKIVDGLFNQHSDYAIEIREGYELLLKYYKSKGDSKKQLVYLEKLIAMDSVLNDNYKYINNTIIKNFDTPKFIAEKEAIINRISTNRKKAETKLTVTIIILLIVVIGFVYNYFQKSLYKTKFQELLNTTDKKFDFIIEKTKIDSVDTPEFLNISDDVVNRIQQHLTKFENEKGFITQNITVNRLAKTMETNSKYLAKVIKSRENKKFIDYINDLRISYAIDKLKKEKKFRKYTIEAIAVNSGFSNPRSFSQAFYKKSGIKPSYFIKELNKLSNN